MAFQSLKITLLSFKQINTFKVDLYYERLGNFIKHNCDNLIIVNYIYTYVWDEKNMNFIKVQFLIHI